MPVNKERVGLLVDALRGKRYTQGRDRLCSLDNKMCCLGVACDVYRAATGIGEWLNYSTGSKVFEIGIQLDYSVLPDVVRSWYGFETVEPEIGGVRAPVANDARLYDFETIANLFETEYITNGE